MDPDSPEPPLNFRSIIPPSKERGENDQNHLCWLFFLFITILGLVFLLSLGPKKIDNSGSSFELEKAEKGHPVVPGPEKEKPVQTEKPIPKTCLTPECLNFVRKVRSSMDSNISPCDDFYEHACGNFEKKAKKLKDYEIMTKDAFSAVTGFLKSNSTESLLPSEKVLRALYWKCAVRDKNLELQELLEDVRSVDSGDFDGFLDEILLQYLKLDSNSTQLFSISTHQNQLRIAPNFCKIDYEPIDLKVLDDAPLDLKELLRSSLDEALEVDQIGVQCSEELRRAGSDEILMPGEQFPWKESVIDFEKILKRLMGTEASKNWETLLKRVVVVDPQQFLGLESAINTLITSHPKKLSHYLTIKYIEKYVKDSYAPDVHDHCVKNIFTAFPRTFLSTYVNHFLRHDTFQAVPSLIKTMKLEFHGLLDNATWMDRNTVRTVKDRISRFTMELGGAREEQLMEYTDVCPGSDTYYRMRKNLNRVAVRKASEFVVEEKELVVEQMDSRANLNRWVEPNEILHSLLADPIFDSNFPLAVQLGRAGFQVGRELGHLMNPRDRRQKPDPEWSESTMTEFHARGSCAVESMFLTEVQKVTSPAYRQAVADYLGLLAAWNAFQGADKSKSRELEGLEDLTDQQLFFYANVQKTCQDKDRFGYKDHKRVNGMISQLSGFQEAFHCPIWSPMRPVREDCGFF